MIHPRNRRLVLQRGIDMTGECRPMVGILVVAVEISDWDSVIYSKLCESNDVMK